MNTKQALGLVETIRDISSAIDCPTLYGEDKALSEHLKETRRIKANLDSIVATLSTQKDFHIQEAFGSTGIRENALSLCQEAGRLLVARQGIFETIQAKRQEAVIEAGRAKETAIAKLTKELAKLGIERKRQETENQFYRDILSRSPSIQVVAEALKQATNNISDIRHKLQSNQGATNRVADLVGRI